MDEALIQKIIEEVLKNINSGGTGAPGGCSDAPRMLVIGELCGVPEDVQSGYSLTGLEDYEKHRDIGRYSLIYITKLSLADLSNIAMGRDDTAASCAVVNGLLRGIEVCLSEKALWYRKLAGKGSSRLYSVIDGNVRMLESYGVKVTEKEKTAMVRQPRPPKFCTPRIPVPKGTLKPNAGCVITERMAAEMVKENRSHVEIPREAIVTPSAWDVFTNNKIDVERI